MISFNKEQVFIVTGASSGLGEGTALLLNELGATVVGIARNEERLNRMKAKCKHPENMHLEIKDLTEDIETLPQYLRELKNKYGKFQGLAYCAGIVDITPLQNMDYAHLKRVFDINYFVPIMLIKAFCDRRINTRNNAAVVSISSLASKSCDKGMLAYAGSKSALTASSRSIAKEVAKSGVRINTVSPSHIEKNMPNTLEHIRKDYLEAYRDIYPLGYGEPKDVSNVIVFLLSSEAKWITAQDYVIDCGVM